MLIPINLFNILYHEPENNSPFLFYFFLPVYCSQSKVFLSARGAAWLNQDAANLRRAAVCLFPAWFTSARSKAFLSARNAVCPAGYLRYCKPSRQKDRSIFVEQVQLKPLFDCLLNCRRHRRRDPAVKGIGNHIFRR